MRFKRRWLAASAVIGLAGCATQAPPIPAGAATPATHEATAVVMATSARSLIGSPRGEVLAALGPATVIRFDSGYEVWVYRFVEPAARKRAKEPAAASGRQGEPDRARRPSELVMLFTPAGVVAKVRVRAEEPAS